MRRRTNVPSPVDSINTLVEQLQQTDSSVEDGEIVWVRSTQCLWVYRVNSGLVANGTDVVASLYGNGVWVRSNMTLGATGDLLQTAWFIDPTNGNDANDGSTLATALKTDAERQRRWGSIARIVAPTTVTYTSSPPATDKVNYDVMYMEGASLTITGTPTITNPNVSLTAVQVLDRTTSPTTRWAITGVGLGAADVARIVAINAGPRVGAYALVLKDEGGGKVDVSPFGTLDIANAAALANGFAQVTPLVADTVDVMTFPVLTVGSFVARVGTQSNFTAAPANCVLIQNVQLDGTGGGANNVIGSIVSLGASFIIGRALLRNVRVAGWGGFYQCGGGVLSLLRWEFLGSQNGGPFCIVNGTGFAKGAGGAGVVTNAHGGSMAIDGDATLQDMSFFNWGFATMGRVGMYDRIIADLAWQNFLGGVIRCRTFLVATLVYGDNNLGVGCKVFAGSFVTYGTKPTINTSNGAGRQTIIGGVNTDWAAVPAVTAANNAMIVVDV
jgi:hypothetical protein